jgi:coenzyme F420 hydrogenase subunit beta
MITDSLQGVIDAGMCIGCGACALVDPTIELRLNHERLIFEPDRPAGADAASVCPAVQVDFASLQADLFPGREPGPYGVVDSVHLAQSTNLERNRKASSGGLIKELLIELLSRPDVDGVIALDHVAGLEFAGRLITDPSEVDVLPGSIYHNLVQTPSAELLRRNEGRFVLVAIPCQLEGLYNYIQRFDPDLRRRIHTTIGLLCGWQYSYHSINAIARYNRIDPATISDISYRGGGPIGPLKIRTDDGQVHSVNRRVNFGYQVAFDRHMNTPRCHLCVNHGNFLADIVVGDAWLPNTLRSKTGVSLVTCRTPATTELLLGIAEQGRVVLADASTEELRLSQKDRVAHGDFAYAYAEYLDEIGVHRPAMIGPNRSLAKLVPRREVEHFHRELERKLRLAASRRYRLLWIRKGTVEIRRFVGRYLNWFRNRVIGDRASKSRLDEQVGSSVFR